VGSVNSCLVGLLIALVMAGGSCAADTGQKMAIDPATSTSSLDDEPESTIEAEVEDPDHMTPMATETPPPGQVVERPCHPDAECAAEFVLDGVVWGLSCEAVRDDAVLPESIGSGRAFGLVVAVHPVVGFEQDDVVAINVPGGHCSDDDPGEIHTPWSLAWADQGSSVTLGQAACEIGALSPARAAANECTASETADAPRVTGSCRATRTEEDPLIGPEVRADSTAGAEGWALIFLNLSGAAGDPLAIPAGDEPVKIVWRTTGDGDVSFRAIDPDGTSRKLAWGPEPHSGSNWHRPGDEWGTGWLLDSPGCWTLEVVRGEDTHTVVALVNG
jgi:hypothetical protein